MITVVENSRFAPATASDEQPSGSLSWSRPSRRTNLAFGRYKLLDLLGSGGFSRVFRAEDTHYVQQIVVIKQLRQYGLHPEMRPVARNTFLREASILEQLAHPRIPRLHDHDATGSYLALDFIEGETLEKFLGRRGGKLPLDETLGIGLQLCSILDYLHSRQPPVIFLDLKPANIMLTAGGQVTLIDFGLARLYNHGAYDTVALGTEGRAAPEQYLDDQGKTYPTSLSDIYGLGVLLHQLLSGHDPEEEKPRFTFASLRRMGIALPDTTLFDCIHAMLDRSPGLRPGKISEVAAVLQASQVQMGGMHGEHC